MRPHSMYNYILKEAIAIVYLNKICERQFIALVKHYIVDAHDNMLQILFIANCVCGCVFFGGLTYVDD